MKTTTEDGPWRVTTRINKAGNLAVEVELEGEWHAELVLQEKGVIDLGTKGKPWPLGEKGWDMPGAPADLRKSVSDPTDWSPDRFPDVAVRLITSRCAPV